MLTSVTTLPPNGGAATVQAAGRSPHARPQSVHGHADANAGISSPPPGGGRASQRTGDRPWTGLVAGLDVGKVRWRRTLTASRRSVEVLHRVSARYPLTPVGRRMRFTC